MHPHKGRRWRKTGSLASLFFLFTCCLLFAQSAESLFRAGSKAFQDGLFVMADRSFRALAQLYPDSALADDAEFLRALAQFYLQEYKSSIAVFQQYLRQYPRSPYGRRVHFWLGSSYYNLRQYQEALGHFSVQAEKFPEEKEFAARALLMKGACQEKLQLWAEAVRTYRALLENKGAPEFLPVALFRLGSVQLALEDYSAALASFSRILIDLPDSPQAADSLFYAAESYFFLDKPIEAERRYRLVLAGGPTAEQRETILYRLVKILPRQGKSAEALKLCGELEAGYPRGRYSEEIALLKAEILFDLKRYPEAQALYQKALRSGAAALEKQKLYYNLALAALSSGNAEAALEPLASALEGGDEIAEKSLFRLAAAQADLHREEQATRTLEQFRARFPASVHNEEILGLMGSLYEQTGRSREAQEAFAELLSRYPFSSKKDEYLFKRGSSRLATGDTSGALKDFFAIVQTLPASSYLAESQYNIGYVYSQRGEYQRALPYFTAAVELDKDSELAGRATLAAGVCLFNAGEYGQALSWFARIHERPAYASWAGESWFYAGRTYYKLERLQEAADSFAKAADALAGKAEGEEALFWQGLSLFRLNRLGPAKEVFLALAARYPKGPRLAEAFYRVGMCASLAGGYAESIGYFDQALRAAAGSAASSYARELAQEVLFQKGLSLFKSGNRAKAAAVYESLAKDYPGSPMAAEAFFKLAEEDFRAGSYPEALKGFRRVFKEYPRQPAAAGALYWAGASAARTGERGEALDYLLRYLETAPQGGLPRLAEEEIRTILSGLASAVSAEGQESAARLVRDFYQRVEAGGAPADVKNRVRFEYARYIFPGAREEALSILLRVRDSGVQEPLKSETSLMIGEYYRLRGDLNRALDVYSGITSASSGRSAASAQMGIARIREQQSRSEEAAEEFLKIYFLYPEAADLAEEGLFQAGRLYLALGRKDRADSLFEKLKAEFPASRWLKDLPSR